MHAEFQLPLINFSTTSFRFYKQTSYPICHREINAIHCWKCQTQSNERIRCFDNVTLQICCLCTNYQQSILLNTGCKQHDSLNAYWECWQYSWCRSWAEKYHARCSTEKQGIIANTFLGLFLWMNMDSHGFLTPWQLVSSSDLNQLTNENLNSIGCFPV
jgi:hypothetical protein